MGAFALVALMAMALPPVASAEYEVTIRRTDNGIPHVIAGDWGDLAYGYGYALAEDNVCTLADTYTTVRAERSKYFGPDDGYTFQGNGFTVNNLNSDFFFQRIIDDQVDRGPGRPAAARAAPRPRSARRSPATSRATTATSATPASPTSPTSAAPASPGSTRSTR